MNRVGQPMNNVKTMLIVEDHERMRAILREVLLTAFPGSTVLEAATGASAMALCRERCPVVVLMDIGLPDANGIDLAARITAMLPRTAVIIVSSHGSSAHVARSLAAGAFAFVAKDAIREELLPALAAALDGAIEGDASKG